MYIERTISDIVRRNAASFKVVTLTGPRQSGKTTLARHLFPGYRYVSLEDLDVRAFASGDPRSFLSQYDNHCVFDEVQRVPELLSYLQTKVDERPETAQYILTGSQNFTLAETISQTLVGRTSLQTLLALSADEIRSVAPSTSLLDIIHRGQYPALYAKELLPGDFYEPYTALYLERDVRDLRQVADLALFRDFMALVAGRVGQLMNYSDIANVIGRDVNTVKQWLSVLETSFIIFRIRPFLAQTPRRLSKSPKFYFFDTGLLCHLLGIRNTSDLQQHYQWGGIFENYVIAERYKMSVNYGKQPRLHFLRDKTGNEIDLVEQTDSGLTFSEIKAAQTFSSDMIKGLNAFADITDGAGNAPQTQVIYRGEPLGYQGVQFINP